MKIISINILLFISTISYLFSQDTIVKYFNTNWEEVKDKNIASFYRKAFKGSDNLWIAHDYYISNKIQMIGTYKSEKLNIKYGHFSYFYENGKKKSEGDYINNDNDGFWTYWYENGQKRSEGNYKNDLKQGKWEYWHENGKKKSEGRYTNSNSEGLWQFWYDSGEKQSEGIYSGGVKDSIWTYWYKSGKLEFVEKYKRSKSFSITGYFENDSLEFKGNYVNDELDGEWVYWNIDGKVFFKGKYSKGVKVDEWIRYFPDGTNMKIYYDNGRQVSTQLGGIIHNE